jgi:hypothetical protein
MGSASLPRSGSLNGWQDFGHEDTAVTRNDRMRAQLGSLLLPTRPAATVSPGLHSQGDVGPTTPATADSRDRLNVRMWHL